MVERSRKPGDLHGNARVQQSIRGFLVTDAVYEPASVIPRHEHELASFCVVLAGGYNEDFGRRARQVEPGTVIVHPQGEQHQEVHDPERVRLLTIEIEPKTFAELAPAACALEDAWHRRDYVITALGFRLSTEIAVCDVTSQLVVESSIMDMLGALTRVRVADVKRAPWIRMVRERLQTDSVDSFSMRDLSEMAGVHPVYLARAFRGSFGCSIGGYVRKLQVGRAALMLQNSELSLASIAIEAGFADQSHMTRVVRSHTGLTPGELRTHARQFVRP